MTGAILVCGRGALLPTSWRVCKLLGKLCSFSQPLEQINPAWHLQYRQLARGSKARLPLSARS